MRKEVFFTRKKAEINCYQRDTCSTKFLNSKQWAVGTSITIFGTKTTPLIHTKLNRLTFNKAHSLTSKQQTQELANGSKHCIFIIENRKEIDTLGVSVANGSWSYNIHSKLIAIGYHNLHQAFIANCILCFSILDFLQPINISIVILAHWAHYWTWTLSLISCLISIK